MKTIVALFDERDAAQRAVDALVQTGISRDDISMVANNATGDYESTPATKQDEDAVTAGQGATFGAIVGGLVGLGALLIPGIGPVLAAGPLAVALGAGVGALAGAATGGITAALVKTGVPEEQAGYYSEGVRRGGTLVTVNATDANSNRVQQILDEHGVVDLNQRSSYYQSTGYTGPDTNAAPYTADQVAREYESIRTFKRNGEERVLGMDTVSQSGMPAGSDASTETEAGNMAMSTSALPFVGLAGSGNAGMAGVMAMSTTPDPDVSSAESDRLAAHDRSTTSDFGKSGSLGSSDTSGSSDTYASSGMPSGTDYSGGSVMSSGSGMSGSSGRTGSTGLSGSAGMSGGTDYSGGSVMPSESSMSGRSDMGSSMAGVPRTWDSYQTDFRNRYERDYANSGYTFEEYTPAFQYGYSLAKDTRYSDYDWDRLEPEARTQWETQHADTPWESFKDAVRDTWQSVRGAVTPNRY